MNKILIVEDEADIQALLHCVLTANGFEVFRASNEKRSEDKIFDYFSGLHSLHGCQYSLWLCFSLKKVYADS